MVQESQNITEDDMVATVAQRSQLFTLMTKMSEMVSDEKHSEEFTELCITLLQEIIQNPNDVQNNIHTFLKIGEWEKDVAVGGALGRKEEIWADLNRIVAWSIYSQFCAVLDDEKFVISQELKPVSFGCVTVRKLGFFQRVPMERVISRIKELGHKPCMPEDCIWLILNGRMRKMRHGCLYFLATRPIRNKIIFFRKEEGEDYSCLSIRNSNYLFGLNDSVIFRL